MSGPFEEGSRGIEREHTMAIPMANGENHPCIQMDQSSMDIDNRKLPESVEDETAISVRWKGKGKEIRINADPVIKPVDSPIVAVGDRGCLQETSLKPDNQSSPNVKPSPPDIRSFRKRNHSINTNPSGEKPYFSPDLLPPTPDICTSDTQHYIKPTNESKTKHILPVKKRKRPDSPQKKRFLKSYDQSTDAIPSETILKVLRLLKKEGVTLNGKKYEIRLIPVNEDPPADESYLKRHGFSPGTDVSLSWAPCPQQGPEGSCGLIKERGDMPGLLSIPEESLPTVGSVVPVPVVIQDSPLDLSSSSMLEYQMNPFDYSTGPEYSNRQDYSTGPLDYSTGLEHSTRPDYSTGPLDYSNGQSQEAVTRTADMTNLPINHDDSLEIVDSINKPADIIVKQEDNELQVIEQDNLPSLEHETMNLNLGSNTMPAMTGFTNQNILTSPEFLQRFIAVRLVGTNPGFGDPLHKQPVSGAGPSNTNSNNHENKVFGIVPDLVHLNLTEEDGTIIQSPTEKLKQRIKQKIQGE